MSDEQIPWKSLVLDENDLGPEGNVWTGCHLCGGKWRSDDGWIYREKVIEVPQEVQKLLTMIGRSTQIARWEYRCPNCLPDDYVKTE